MKILISLIGGQPAPVYIGCLNSNPDLNIFITSKDTLKQANRLRKALSHYDTKIVESEPFNFEQLSQLISDILQEFHGNDLILNLTSGTKIMSLAAFTVFREKNLEMIYVDSQNGNILHFDSFGNVSVSKDNVRISISNYFSLYGHDLQSVAVDNSRLVEEKKIALEFMSKYYVHVKMIIPELNKQLKDKKRTLFEICDDRSGTILRYNKKKSTGKFIINLGRSKPELTIGSDVMFNYVGGGWFEDYVANEIVSSNLFDDIIRNSRLIVDVDNQREYRNEFDILAMKGQTVFVFECKSGNLDKSMIDKLRLIRAISGTYSRIYLVTLFSPTSKNYLEWVKDFSITLLTKDSLKEFLNNLANQSDSNPNP